MSQFLALKIFLLVAFGVLSGKSWGENLKIFEGSSAILYDTGVPLIGKQKIRSGVYFENPQAPLKACVIYLQGLGDSFKNQVPLFRALNSAGYRVLTFDYMGQGGSTGTMDNTRIIDPLFPSLQISNMSKFIWNRLIFERHPAKYSDCTNSKKIAIGWSTGGLAAYHLAYQQSVDAVILLAPGLFPKKLIGEAALKPYKALNGSPVITVNTLTRKILPFGEDPHVEAPRPHSPYMIPGFVANILASAAKTHFWKISKNVSGLVFATDHNDLYVHGPKAAKLIERAADHFKVIQISGAKHEIANELPHVSQMVYKKTIEFLNTVAHH